MKIANTKTEIHTSNSKSNKYKILQEILFLIGAAGFIFFIAPVAMSVNFNIGNMTGVLIGLILILYGVFFNTINSMIYKTWQKKIGKPVLIIIAGFLLIIIATALILTIFMFSAANKSPNNKDATLVILGCRVNGENASLMLTERLQAAQKYLESNKNADCVLSGGQGSGEDISEAECMYRYLVNNGIDSKRLYLEEKSTSTRENLAFSQTIIEKNNLNPDIIIVTNEYHELRAGMIADSLDIENHYSVPAKTAYWLLPSFYIRELYGILFEFFF